MARQRPSTFFRLRTPAGNTWPPVPEPSASALWAAFLELERTQWLDAAALEQRQLTQARLLLSHCSAHVPYYRDLLAETRIAPQDIQTLDDFRRLPILPRRTFQEQFPRLCAQVLPRGTNQTGQAHIRHERHTRSGAPDQPGQFLVASVHAPRHGMVRHGPARDAGRHSHYRKNGVELARLLEGVSLPTWGQALQTVIATGPSHGMDVAQDPRRQLQWLRRIGPDFLLSYPSNLEYLAGLVRAEGQPIPNLRVIQSIGETLTEEGRAAIECGFGVPVKNTYSCVEVGYVASPCPAGHGLHVHSENVILEVLDDQDRPCSPGQTGRVLLTTLHNFLSPFIRYDIGDEAEVGEPCPCGRGLPRLMRILGKQRIMVRLPNGKVKRSSSLAVAFRKLGGCQQFQVVQRAVDHVLLRIVPDRTWTDEHPARLTQLLHDFFEGPLRVDVETLERIPLTPGGKVRDFISELQPAKDGETIQKQDPIRQ